MDVVYYGAQGRELEYDFIVAPGADPKAIKLSFEGADKLELNEQGDLVLRLSGKPIQLRKPVVYQEKDGVRQEIASNYTLAGAREAGIGIAAYDASRPLVIDPALAYSTYLERTWVNSNERLSCHIAQTKAGLVKFCPPGFITIPISPVQVSARAGE